MQITELILKEVWGYFRFTHNDSHSQSSLKMKEYLGMNNNKSIWTQFPFVTRKKADNLSQMWWHEFILREWFGPWTNGKTLFRFCPSARNSNLSGYFLLHCLEQRWPNSYSWGKKLLSARQGIQTLEINIFLLHEWSASSCMRQGLPSYGADAYWYHHYIKSIFACYRKSKMRFIFKYPFKDNIIILIKGTWKLKLVL